METHHQTSCPESLFLTQWFRQLNDHGISYCVLRNYDDLPFTAGGSDIDVHISTLDIHSAVEMAHQVAKQCGGVCISMTRWFSMYQVCYCGFTGQSWWGIRLDMLSEQTYKGIVFFDANQLLQERSVRNGVQVAHPSDAAMLCFLKDALSTGSKKCDSLAGARAAYKGAHRTWQEKVGGHFDARTARHLAMFLGEPGSISFDRVVISLRWGLMIRAISADYVSFLARRLASTRDRIRRVFCRPGTWIAVVGCDGSGKSTVIEGVRPVLEAAMHNSIRYVHMRPNLLPSIAGLLGRRGTNGPVADPHSSKPSGFIGSVVRLLYYSLDYIFGYWLKVCPALVKRPTLYVFDRYYYDYLIDPRRSRICLPRWIIKAIGLLVPRPDLILCLGADPAIIHARKPELPLEEIERQVAELKRFCVGNKRAVWIDTGCSIDESVDKALEAITSRMAARYEQKRKR